MAKTTFWDLIERTIEKVGTPLSAKEIWEKANELGTIGDFTTTGKTPWATIAAYCYTAINSGGENSMIIQTSERPAQFFLRKLTEKIDVQKVQKQKDKMNGYIPIWSAYISHFVIIKLKHWRFRTIFPLHQSSYFHLNLKFL